jgi:hypothetical protein
MFGEVHQGNGDTMKFEFDPNARTFEGHHSGETEVDSDGTTRFFFTDTQMSSSRTTADGNRTTITISRINGSVSYRNDYSGGRFFDFVQGRCAPLKQLF